jgi:uncharacterized membrane protein
MSSNVGERILPRQSRRCAAQPAPRWLVAVAAGVLVSVSVWVLSAQREIAILAGWDASILVYLALTALVSERAGPAQREAQAAEPVAPLALAAVMAISVLGFVVALGLAGQIGQPHSTEQALRVGLAMVAVLGSWLLMRVESRLHLAKLRHERKKTGIAGAGSTAAQTRPEMLLNEASGFWEFMYYAFPTIGRGEPSDPAPVTPKMCRVAVLDSVMMYASAIILFSFGLSLIGPALNSARVVLGG